MIARRRSTATTGALALLAACSATAIAAATPFNPLTGISAPQLQSLASVHGAVILPQRLPAGFRFAALHIVEGYYYGAVYSDSTRTFIAENSSSDLHAGPVFATVRTLLGTLKLIRYPNCYGAGNGKYAFTACGAWSRGEFEQAVASIRVVRNFKATGPESPSGLALKLLTFAQRRKLRTNGVPALLPRYLPSGYRITAVSAGSNSESGYRVTISNGRAEITINGSTGGWGGVPAPILASLTIHSAIFGPFQMVEFGPVPGQPRSSASDTFQIRDAPVTLGNAAFGFFLEGTGVPPAVLRRVLESLELSAF